MGTTPENGGKLLNSTITRASEKNPVASRRTAWIRPTSHATRVLALDFRDAVERGAEGATSRQEMNAARVAR